MRTKKAIRLAAPLAAATIIASLCGGVAQAAQQTPSATCTGVHIDDLSFADVARLGDDFTVNYSFENCSDQTIAVTPSFTADLINSDGSECSSFTDVGPTNMQLSAHEEVTLQQNYKVGATCEGTEVVTFSLIDPDDGHVLDSAKSSKLFTRGR
jgi:hypothetical protein